MKVNCELENAFAKFNKGQKGMCFTLEHENHQILYFIAKEDFTRENPSKSNYKRVVEGNVIYKY